MKKTSSEIRSKFKVKQIGVFGSQIKGKAKRHSDIDILVEFEKGCKTFDNYMELKFYLEDIFNCKVDLVLKDALKEEIRPIILSEVVYV
ncbi:MAG TPA: nucleotidyltransferase family protein [bacterium]|nr:nucleotidyltransferase family protein [bacterium]HOL35592.1 nucleotidyltransferase family protein [bacterium]HPP08967.1 nucleotidyltransferase family protein [bacterium]